MNKEDTKNKLDGIQKYEEDINELDFIDTQYFPIPRHSIKRNINSKDLSILMAICFHTNIFNGKESFVFEESIERIIVSLGKDKRYKSDYVSSLENLVAEDIISIEGDINGVFDVKILMPNGYATVTYGEFKKLAKFSGRGSWNVHAVFFVMNCSLYISDNKLSSHVFFRRQEYIAGILAISHKTCSRAFSDLESAKIIAVYHVRLMDSVKQKAVASRYIHRDSLRKWLAKEIQKPYASVYEIINETGEREVND